MKSVTPGNLGGLGDMGAVEAPTPGAGPDSGACGTTGRVAAEVPTPCRGPARPGSWRRRRSVQTAPDAPFSFFVKKRQFNIQCFLCFKNRFIIFLFLFICKPTMKCF